MKRNQSIKPKVRRARCKQVLAILLNRIETVELIREEVHPPIGDLGESALELAVVKWNGLEVYVPLECVVFLGGQPYAERAREWGLKFLAMTCTSSNPDNHRRVSQKGKRRLPPEVDATLRFISENMELSEFSGKITPNLKKRALQLYQQGKLKRKSPLFGAKRG